MKCFIAICEVSLVSLRKQQVIRETAQILSYSMPQVCNFSTGIISFSIKGFYQKVHNSTLTPHNIQLKIGLLYDPVIWYKIS